MQITIPYGNFGKEERTVDVIDSYRNHHLCEIDQKIEIVSPSGLKLLDNRLNTHLPKRTRESFHQWVDWVLNLPNQQNVLDGKADFSGGAPNGFIDQFRFPSITGFNEEIYTENNLQKSVKENRDAKFARSKQFSLGKLIAEMEKCGVSKRDGYAKILYFDFGSAIPTELSSYRGAYNELALGYGLLKDIPESQRVTAPQLLDKLKEAIGKTYSGWLNGEYTMSKNTPIWVANPGENGHTGIVGIIDDSWRLIILTEYTEY